MTIVYRPIAYRIVRLAVNKSKVKRTVVICFGLPHWMEQKVQNILQLKLKIHI